MKEGPQFLEGIIDPYEVLADEIQIFGVRVSDSSPVLKVEVSVKTDKKIQTYPLALKTENADGGYWEGRWKIDDSIDFIYRLAITATDSNQKSSQVEITLR